MRGWRRAERLTMPLWEPVQAHKAITHIYNTANRVGKKAKSIGLEALGVLGHAGTDKTFEG